MLHCKNTCHLLEGYRSGYANYQVKGNKACLTCDYQISPIFIHHAIRCPCCKQKYRIKKHYYSPQKREEQKKMFKRIDN